MMTFWSMFTDLSILVAVLTSLSPNSLVLVDAGGVSTPSYLHI
jgi:hypothetical protein